MFVLLTILMLVAAPLVVGLALVFSPQRNFTWVIATIGAFAAWLLTLLWQLELPATITLAIWRPEALFSQSPILRLDGVSWAYGLSLSTLCLAVVVTMPARMSQVRALAAVGNLLLTALGLFAVLADNPLTLLLSWSAIDLTELAVLLGVVRRPEQSERAVVGFSVRLAGSGLVLWAIAGDAPGGGLGGFQGMTDNTAILLLLGAGLRLGILPLNLPLGEESVLRRGFGTILRMVSVTSSLVLLARLPATEFSPGLDALALLATSAAALYGAWRWVRGATLLDSRPFWMIAMGALALAADLRGNPPGSVAWGSALVLVGGLIFIFSHETRWLRGLVLGGVFGLSALPFSMTAVAWQSGPASNPWFLVVLIPAQVLLVVGFIRFALAPRDPSTDIQPQGAQVVYPVAFIVMFLVIILLGVWGWEGAGQVGAWIPGLVASALSVALTVALMRLQALIPARSPESELPRASMRGVGLWLGGLLWGIYRLLRQAVFVLSQALEGDGGMLWAFVLLVLVISLFTGGR